MKMFKFFALICAVMFNVDMSDQLSIPVPNIGVTPLSEELSFVPGDNISYQIKIDNIFWTTYTPFKITMSATLANGQTGVDPVASFHKLYSPDTSQEVSSSLEFQDMLAFDLGISEVGYTNAVVVYHIVKCLDTTAANTMSSYMSFLMSDNPVLDTGEEVITTITVEVENEFHFIYQNYITKSISKNITLPLIESDNDQIHDLKTDFKHFPNSGVALFIFIKNMKKRMTNITFTFQLPTGSMFRNFRMEPMINSYGHLVEANETTNSFKYYIPYFDPAGGEHFLKIVFDAPDNEILHSTARVRKISADFLLTYCPTYSCSEATTKAKYTFIIPTVTIQPTNMWTDKSVRLKFTKYGTCFERNNANEKIIATSTCRSSFIFRSNGTLKSKENDLFLIVNNSSLGSEIALSSNATNTYWLYHEHMLINQQERVRSFVIQKDPVETKVYAMAPENNYRNEFNLVTKTNASMKLLPVWKNMGDIIIKSVLYEEPTQLVYVCNPAGDLGNRPNCFYTSNLGMVWTALPSTITYIVFKTTDSGDLYGKCNRGKAFCKITINSPNDARLEFVNEQEFSTIRFSGSGTSEIFNLDEVLLTDVPMKRWSDGKIGVSSVGVYKTEEAAQWKRIFTWGF